MYENLATPEKESDLGSRHLPMLAACCAVPPPPATASPCFPGAIAEDEDKFGVQSDLPIMSQSSKRQLRRGLEAISPAPGCHQPFAAPGTSMV